MARQQLSRAEEAHGDLKMETQREAQEAERPRGRTCVKRQEAAAESAERELKQRVSAISSPDSERNPQD
ncbi:hypothetical protein IscW_ISCW008550 [Ixodes scapularis]|uniref:Uncharacterized protein n=1 Tax=Ixodes scapularis TaxID=6945 RepID=B7Q335_IXOSC|nr:hypothetical protein IscW_ISCW008550 [Ixodes scapularis]|eukprot:XP_002411133.1 hypothetical protein IscW_ISCW008550 [Ixodes scapularis]